MVYTDVETIHRLDISKWPCHFNSELWRPLVLFFLSFPIRIGDVERFSTKKKPQFYIISSRWRVSMASDWQLVAGWLHLVEFSSWFQLGTWIGVSFLTFTQVWLEIGLKIGGDFIWVLETGQNCVWSWAEIPNLTENWFRNWLKFYFHFGHNSKFNWRLVEILVKISFEFSNLPENWFRNWEEFHLNFGDWSELQLNSSFWIKFEIEMKIGWEIGDNIILVLETD